MDRTMIKVENLSKTYRRYKKKEGLAGSLTSLFHREYEEKDAVRNVSFSIGKGEFIGLIGPNGAGKTTLVKMLTGIIAPTSGMIDVMGYYPNDMKNEFNRYGLAKTYDGIGIAAISGARRQGNGNLLIPSQRIFGIAGKVGNLDMKGDIHVYQDMNNKSEQIHLMLKDFTYGFAITKIENCAKIVLSA